MFDLLIMRFLATLAAAFPSAWTAGSVNLICCDIDLFCLGQVIHWITQGNCSA